MEIDKKVKFVVEMNGKKFNADCTLYYYDDDTLDVPELSYDTEFEENLLDDEELELYSELESEFINGNYNTMLFEGRDVFNLVYDKVGNKFYEEYTVAQ